MPRHINLIDPPRKTCSPYFKVQQMGVPILIVLLAMGSWGGWMRLRVALAKQKLNAVETQLQPAQEQLNRIQAGLGAEQINAELREQLAKAELNLKARKDIQTALQRGELGATQGFSGMLSAFARQTVPGLWLTGMTLDGGGRDIALSGQALQADAVAALVRALHTEPILSGRAIATLKIAPAPAENTVGVNATAVDMAGPAPGRPGATYEFQISSVAAPTVQEAPGASGTTISPLTPKVVP